MYAWRRHHPARRPAPRRLHGSRAVCARDRDGGAGIPDRAATIVSADGDWSFAYTRLYGDFVRTSFTRAVAAPVVATAFTLTGVQTLSPRWFVAGRAQRLTTSDRVESRSSPAYGYGYGHDTGTRGVTGTAMGTTAMVMTARTAP